MKVVEFRVTIEVEDLLNSFTELCILARQKYIFDLTIGY